MLTKQEEDRIWSFLNSIISSNNRQDHFLVTRSECNCEQIDERNDEQPNKLTEEEIKRINRALALLAQVDNEQVREAVS